MKLFTSQYRYNKPDRLDVTIKSEDYIGKLLAPPPSLVYGIKNGHCDTSTYLIQYVNHLASVLHKNPEIFNDIQARETVTLVCFCPPATFCHRYILADFLTNLGSEYCGEIVNA